ncbi:unnamed protein product [Rotaria socialis]|uniref:Uncharacterized protein n=1 Tax=Rotaria socialis TaxID=392032 RepID=A0A821UBT8_9BILA|nr:unnamed protein product [Rotaria socialis]
MWKQPINFEKTQLTLFHRQVAPKIPLVTCDGYEIAHTNYIETKIRKNLAIFKRLASSRMLSEEVAYQLYNAYIRPHYQSLLNIYPLLSISKQNKLEALNRQVFRSIHGWYDATNTEVSNLCKYKTIDELTQVHWVKLIGTILRTNPSTKLPKLKYFSLISYNYTSYYDDLVCPLLHRMINLEELKLYLFVRRFDSIYIDGIQLYDQILIYTPRLNKFTFSIKTRVVNKNIRINLSSNENIQRSFIGKKYGQVDSYVHTRSTETKGECHIDSFPYEFEYFHDLNISFPGGMFRKVRNLMMFAHVNYVEQFLLKKYTHLPNFLNLYIRYESLAKITNNFTNDVVRLNFDKLKGLHIRELFVGSQSFHKYFAFL